MTTVTISMPEAMKQFVDEAVETGGYGDAGEYIRSLLSEAQDGVDEELEKLLLEGLEGESIPITPEFWTELRAEAAEMAAVRARQAASRT